MSKHVSPKSLSMHLPLDMSVGACLYTGKARLGQGLYLQALHGVLFSRKILAGMLVIIST